MNISFPAADASGNLVIYVDGKQLTGPYTLKDGKLENVRVSGLNAGKHSVKVIYEGNDKYSASTGVCDFNVSKAQPTLDVSINSVKYNETFTISVNSLTGVDGAGLSGDVIVTVDGKRRRWLKKMIRIGHWMLMLGGVLGLRSILSSILSRML